MIEPRGQSRTDRRARMGAGTFDRMGRAPRGPSRSAGEGSPTGRIARPGGRTGRGATGRAREDARSRAENEKNRLGGYPGRSSNSAPDEGDGTRTARGIPPAWHSRADRADRT